jgi:hypothetical protein
MLARSLSVAPPRKSLHQTEGVPQLLAPGSWPADAVCISDRCMQRPIIASPLLLAHSSYLLRLALSMASKVSGW